MLHGAIFPAPSLPLIPATFFEIVVLQLVGSWNLAAESALCVIAQQLDVEFVSWRVTLGDRAKGPDAGPIILLLVNLTLFHVCMYVT